MVKDNCEEFGWRGNPSERSLTLTFGFSLRQDKKELVFIKPSLLPDEPCFTLFIPFDFSKDVCFVEVVKCCLLEYFSLKFSCPALCVSDATRYGVKFVCSDIFCFFVNIHKRKNIEMFIMYIRNVLYNNFIKIMYFSTGNKCAFLGFFTFVCCKI